MFSPYSVIASESWEEFVVWPATDDQEQPDIYGDIIVWQQFVDGDWDVYGVDITEPANPSFFGIADFVSNKKRSFQYSSGNVFLK